MDAGSFSPDDGIAGRRTAAAERLKVFLSYSRADIDFADQMVMLLEARGFDPIIDRHDIDAAEKWKQRLGDLLFSCDTVVFVLSEKSASSPICAWEVEHAASLGKRMIPILPRPCAAPAPPQLAELNYIHMFRDPALPGTSFSDGMAKLERALKVDLAWLRDQTRLSEQAERWMRRGTSPDAASALLRGNVLAEALDWSAHAPRGASVSVEVQDFLRASQRAEAQLKAEAAAQLAEREAAVQRAEMAARQVADAQAAQVRSNRRFRLLAVIALGVGLALTVGAGAAGWLALQNNDRARRAAAQAGENAARAAEARSATFAGEAAKLLDVRAYPQATLMALYGDPAATADDGVHRLRPGGFPVGLQVLQQAYSQRPLATLEMPDVNRNRGGRSSDQDDNFRHVLNSAAFSRDGARIVMASNAAIAGVFDAQSGARQGILIGHRSYLNSAAFIASGKRLVTSSSDGTVRVWDAATYKEVAKTTLWATPSGRPKAGMRASAGVPMQIDNAQVSRDETRIVVSGFLDPALRILDTGALQQLDVAITYSDVVRWAEFSPDGSKIVSASDDKTAQIWDAASGDKLRSLTGHTEKVVHAAFSPDGSRIATSSAGDDLVSPAGSIRIWNAKTGDLLTTINGSSFRSAVFSPDGSRLLSIARDAELWDATTGEHLATLWHKDSPTSAAFSPDGSRIVAAYYDGVGRVWETPDLFKKPAAEQVKRACARLRELGVYDFEPEERKRLRILKDVPPYPCGPPPAGASAWPVGGPTY